MNFSSTYPSLAYAQAAGPVYVSYYTSSGTAKAGVDYQAASTVLAIPAALFASASGTVTLPIYGLGPANGKLLNVTLSSTTSNAAFVAAQTTSTISLFNPQLADGQPTDAPAGVTLTSTHQLAPVIQEAEAAWEAVGAKASSFDNVQFQIGNIGHGVLGNTAGNVITIDAGAAGFGWYVNPADIDFEYKKNTAALFALEGSQAAGHMDLLTVVEHELGHILGLSDMDVGSLSDNLMATSLSAGVRRTPTVNLLTPISNDAPPVLAAPLSQATNVLALDQVFAAMWLNDATNTGKNK